MTTLLNRSNTAVLVVDTQIGVLENVVRRDATVGNLASLVATARAAGVLIVWAQYSDEELQRGSDAWQWVAELQPEQSEPVVHKSYADPFESTDLESILAAAGVGRLFVAGAQTDECIRATIHGAFVRGYDVTLVGDAHSTEDHSQWGAPKPDAVIAHTNLYWQYHRAPGRVAAVVNTRDITFGA